MQKSVYTSLVVITTVPTTFMINSNTINGMIPSVSIYNINPVINIQFSAAVKRSVVAAFSTIPFTPVVSMNALKFFYYKLGDKIWGNYGFYDAVNTSFYF